MAKCRNCKKEIDVTATRCPYCHTKMPTNDFLINFKGICILGAYIGIFIFLMSYLIANTIHNFDIEDAVVWIPILLVVMMVIGLLSAAFFKVAKEREENVAEKWKCIILGTISGVLALGLLTLIIVALISIF